MTNIKSFFLRLYLLTYSPLFPLVLTWTIFMAYRIYFEPVMLCDDTGWNLYQWKREITTYISDYRVAVCKCEKYYDLSSLLQTAKSLNPGYCEPEQEDFIANKIHNWRAEKLKALMKIRQCEAKIKRIDPGFTSFVENFPKVLENH